MIFLHCQMLCSLISVLYRVDKNNFPLQDRDALRERKHLIKKGAGWSKKGVSESQLKSNCLSSSSSSREKSRTCLEKADEKKRKGGGGIGKGTICETKRGGGGRSGLMEMLRLLFLAMFLLFPLSFFFLHGACVRPRRERKVCGASGGGGS